MPISLGGKPLADFGEPIEMMKDCHRRIEHFLDELLEVERRFGNRKLDEDGRHALEASLNYFANFAPRHTADEEHSLFPRMRSSDDSAAHAVMADLKRLESDHRGCEALHLLVDRLVRDWLRRGWLGSRQQERLRVALGKLEEIYAAHIQLEEQRVFAVAARVLRSEQVREIGEEMRGRRSLTSLGHITEGSLEK